METNPEEQLLGPRTEATVHIHGVRMKVPTETPFYSAVVMGSEICGIAREFFPVLTLIVQSWRAIEGQTSFKLSVRNVNHCLGP